MNEKDINNLKEMLVDFNEYSTDYTKTRCKELEETIKNTLKEIERLNTIIKRLEEFIEKEIELYTIELTEKNKGALGYTAPIRGVYKEIYNVLQELKGFDKE